VRDLSKKLVTPDGKSYQRSSAYTIGTRLYVAGCGDDRTNGRGKGQRFELEHSDAGLSPWTSWQFNDWVELGGGGMWYEGAVFGDFVAFQLVAPATPIVPNAGAGNCNVHPTAGILIPAVGGAYDVDTETADAFVPLLQKGGLWTWSYPDTGLGTVVPADDEELGNCQLIPAEVGVHTYVADVGILGDGDLNVTFPGIDPTRVPPQWKMRCRLHNAGGSHTIQLVWELEVGRMNGMVVY